MRRTALTADAPPMTHPGIDGHHTCRKCPACGTEDCRVLSQLGMYCETAQAAQEALSGEASPRPKPARPAMVRRR
jgi:anaerobic ribonucleoside-triphosphate reductase